MCEQKASLLGMPRIIRGAGSTEAVGAAGALVKLFLLVFHCNRNCNEKEMKWI